MFRISSAHFGNNRLPGGIDFCAPAVRIDLATRLRFEAAVEAGCNRWHSVGSDVSSACLDDVIFGKSEEQRVSLPVGGIDEIGAAILIAAPRSTGSWHYGPAPAEVAA